METVTKRVEAGVKGLARFIANQRPSHLTLLQNKRVEAS
jgi:hypothetical protein